MCSQKKVTGQYISRQNNIYEDQTTFIRLNNMNQDEDTQNVVKGEDRGSENGSTTQNQS